MAYSASGIARTSGGDSGLPKTFVYESTDALATIIAADYFLPYYANLSVGDRIEIVSDTANDVVYNTVYVTASSSSTVTVELKETESVWLCTDTTTWQTAAAVGWLAFPFDGYIRRVKAVVKTAVGTTDTVIGLELGGVDVTGAQLTCTTAGSAAGDVFEGTATAANTGAAGDPVEIDTDGAGTAGAGLIMVEFVKA